MGYLQEQFDRLKEKFPETKQIGALRDGQGTYALIIQRGGKTPCYFCAKNSMNKSYISIHKKLFDKAYIERALIVISVQGTLYQITGQTLARSKNYVNEYHDAEMINFSVLNCRKVEMPPPTQAMSGLFPAI